MRRRGLCGSGLIAEASAAVSRARVSTICWSISTCHVLGFFAGAVLDTAPVFLCRCLTRKRVFLKSPVLEKGTPGSVRGRFGQLAVLPRWRAKPRGNLARLLGVLVGEMHIGRGIKVVALALAVILLLPVGSIEDR